MLLLSLGIVTQDSPVQILLKAHMDSLTQHMRMQAATVNLNHLYLVGKPAWLAHSLAKQLSNLLCVRAGASCNPQAELSAASREPGCCRPHILTRQVCFDALSMRMQAPGATHKLILTCTLLASQPSRQHAGSAGKTAL